MSKSSGGGSWHTLEKRRLRVQLDGSLHNMMLDERSALKLSILGGGGGTSSGARTSPLAQLEAGMYFVENYLNAPRGDTVDAVASNKNATPSLYSELMQTPLNRLTEHE